MDVRQNLLQFKLQLMRYAPFYGDILMRLPIRESTKIDTAATNGREILYNPEFFDTLTQGEQNFVLMHEVFHVLLRHAWRNADTQHEHRIWNTACDLVINNMLKAQLVQGISRLGIPFSMPSGALYMPLNNNVTAENIYAQLIADNARNPSLKTVHIEPHEWRSYYNQDTVDLAPANDLLPPPADAKEAILNEQQLKEIISGALSVHQREADRGTGSSIFIPSAIFDLYAAKPLDWRKLLRNMLDRQIGEDTSYATPERKYLHMDLILPGHSASEEVLEEVWVFVDSSGSIPKPTMSAFLTQVHHILRSFHCTMNIAYWDTQVTDVYRKIRLEKELVNCLPHHSGGTDINCVYQWMQKNKIRPDVMIILTDGYFGALKETVTARRLMRKTILLLSTKISESNDMKKIGKIARLTE